jgi:membrane associated rhomboid family serine protease
MFLPLSDNVPMRRLAGSRVTLALIGVNVLIFLMTWGFGDAFSEAAALGFGTIPSVVTGENEIADGIIAAPPYVTLVTSQFLHADWLHLLANMLFLYTFGDNVEDAMGHARYLVFYLACGVVGALAFMLFDLNGVSPLIGASGAISGVVGAYLMLYPNVRVFGLVFNIIPMRIKAVYVLGAWIASQVLYAVVHAGDHVAYTAHVGGALAGAVLVGLFKDRSVPLFGSSPQ